MPNFIEAEKTYGKYFDFVAVNSNTNLELFQKYRVMGTPTIIILQKEEILFNKSGVPNGSELKEIMIKLIGKKPQKVKEVKKKKFLGLF
ncbi:MAG: thioredoxin family protein [Candidatus Gracilibacteria bacterium]|nr:thioredoxin family protein [Candidatus Gracilibacteria bacterium]